MRKYVVNTKTTKSTKSTNNQRSTRNFVLVVVIGMVVALVIIFVGAAAQKNRLESAITSGGSAEQGSQGTPDLKLERRVAEDPLALGAADAPVVMIEYSDFRCPFCGVYARKTQPEIIRKYVDTGQLRIEWRDLPVLGEESVGAAVAGRAAAKQGLFWEFNEAIYAAAPEKGHADLSEPNLLALAESVNIPDMTQFQTDMQDPELLAAVKADLAEGTGLGLNSTPTFVINNQSIPGAQPLEVFAQVIDAALAEASQTGAGQPGATQSGAH